MKDIDDSARATAPWLGESDRGDRHACARMLKVIAVIVGVLALAALFGCAPEVEPNIFEGLDIDGDRDGYQDCRAGEVKYGEDWTFSDDSYTALLYEVDGTRFSFNDDGTVDIYWGLLAKSETDYSRRDLSGAEARILNSYGINYDSAYWGCTGAKNGRADGAKGVRPAYTKLDIEKSWEKFEQAAQKAWDAGSEAAMHYAALEESNTHWHIRGYVNGFTPDDACQPVTTGCALDGHEEGYQKPVPTPVPDCGIGAWFDGVSGSCIPFLPPPDAGTASGSGDYDCAGGPGDGPNYINGPVWVGNDDPYGLDGDGDGWGCE